MAQVTPDMPSADVQWASHSVPGSPVTHIGFDPGLNAYTWKPEPVLLPASLWGPSHMHLLQPAKPVSPVSAAHAAAQPFGYPCHTQYPTFPGYGEQAGLFPGSIQQTVQSPDTYSRPISPAGFLGPHHHLASPPSTASLAAVAAAAAAAVTNGPALHPQQPHRGLGSKSSSDTPPILPGAHSLDPFPSDHLSTSVEGAAAALLAVGNSNVISEESGHFEDSIAQDAVAALEAAVAKEAAVSGPGSPACSIPRSNSLRSVKTSNSRRGRSGRLIRAESCGELTKATYTRSSKTPVAGDSKCPDLDYDQGADKVVRDAASALEQAVAREAFQAGSSADEAEATFSVSPYKQDSLLTTQGRISLPDNIEDDFSPTGSGYEEQEGSFRVKTDDVYTSYPAQPPLDNAQPSHFRLNTYTSWTDLSQLPTDFTDLSVRASPFVPLSCSPEDFSELSVATTRQNPVEQSKDDKTFGELCDDEEDFSKLLGELSVQSLLTY